MDVFILFLRLCAMYFLSVSIFVFVFAVTSENNLVFLCYNILRRSGIFPHKPYIFLKVFLLNKVYLRLILYIEMSLALFVWYCWHRFPLVHSSGNPVRLKRQLQTVSGVLRSDQRVPVSVLVHLGKIVPHLLLIIGILRFFWDAHIYLGLITTSTAW